MIEFSVEVHFSLGTRTTGLSKTHMDTQVVAADRAKVDHIQKVRLTEGQQKTAKNATGGQANGRTQVNQKSGPTLRPCHDRLSTKATMKFLRSVAEFNQVGQSSCV